jgi:hypothetical protein
MITFKQLVIGFLKSIGGMIVGATLVTLWLRIMCFDFTMKDLYIVLAIVLAWPALEYCAHRYLMHEWVWTPFKFTHTRHHSNPVPSTGLPDAWIVFTYWVLSWILLYTTSGIYTAYTTILCMLLWYEFAHYACHTSYKPKTWWGYAIKANHLQHHKELPSRYALLFPIIKVVSTEVKNEI